jgi:DNA-directed RNA polymerase specialized sigma24 family protein
LALLEHADIISSATAEARSDEHYLATVVAPDPRKIPRNPETTWGHLAGHYEFYCDGNWWRLEVKEIFVCCLVFDDEEQIKELLLGSGDDIAAGLNWLDRVYRYKFSGLLRRRFPGMPSEDLPEIWQETLVSLFRMAGSGEFDRQGRLGGLLWTLAVRRGRDHMRRNASWHRPIDVLMRELPQPQLVEKWQGLNELQRGEVVQQICESVERLPPRQNLVWRVYVASHPASERLDYLTEQVRIAAASQTSGTDGDGSGDTLTKKAVSRALQEGRDKIRRDLKRRGHDL